MILRGGFVDRETPTTQAILSYSIMSEINAGNFLARRSLEAIQATEGWYAGHRLMLEAANEGANPSGGPLNRTFRVGNRESSMRSEYKRMQATQTCGRLQAKIEDMKVQKWNLLGIGDQDSADRCEKRQEWNGRNLLRTNSPSQPTLRSKRLFRWNGGKVVKFETLESAGNKPTYKTQHLPHTATTDQLNLS